MAWSICFSHPSKSDLSSPLRLLPGKLAFQCATQLRSQRIPAKQRSIYAVLPDKGQDRSECLLIILGQMNVVQARPQLRVVFNGRSRL